MSPPIITLLRTINTLVTFITVAVQAEETQNLIVIQITNIMR